jgi:hypothetical protein
LPPLDSADLAVVSAYAKNGNLAAGTDFAQVIGIGIQYYPSNAGSDGRLRNLGKSGSTSGLYKYAFYIVLAGYYVKKLLTLADGIIPGKKDFQVHLQASRSRFGRTGLFALVVIIVGDKRDYEAEFLHVSLRRPCRRAEASALTLPCAINGRISPVEKSLALLRKKKYSRFAAESVSYFYHDLLKSGVKFLVMQAKRASSPVQAA